jgi:hypothetical protein
MNNLDALNYLDEHPYSLMKGSKCWSFVYDIAKENGNMDMLRFLFVSQHIHLSGESLQERIVEACKEDDSVELLKMFLLFRPELADFIGRHLSESAWVRLSWLLDSAPILDFLLQEKISLIPDEQLSDELIAFLCSPSSFGFSRSTIKELFLVLERRYMNVVPRVAGDACLRHKEDGNAVIFKFVDAILEARFRRKEYNVDDFVAEIVKSQELETSFNHHQ